MEGEGCYVCGASTVIDYGISAGAGTMACSELLILFFFFPLVIVNRLPLHFGAPWVEAKMKSLV